MTDMEDLVHELTQQRSRLSTVSDESWQKETEEWIASIQTLMDQIVEWLRPARDPESPLLEIDRIAVAISEREGDLYRPVALRVIAPNRRFVEIVPKGRRVEGALGRVDFVSRKGRAILARFGPREWSFVWHSGDQSRWQSQPLTQESLANTLKGMLT